MSTEETTQNQPAEASTPAPASPQPDYTEQFKQLKEQYEQLKSLVENATKAREIVEEQSQVTTLGMPVKFEKKPISEEEKKQVAEKFIDEVISEYETGREMNGKHSYCLKMDGVENPYLGDWQKYKIVTWYLEHKKDPENCPKSDMINDVVRRYL